MSKHQSRLPDSPPLFDPTTGHFGIRRDNAVQVSDITEFTNTRLAGLPMVVINPIVIPENLSMEGVCVFGGGMLKFTGEVTLKDGCSFFGTSFNRVNAVDGWSRLESSTFNYIFQLGANLVVNRSVFRHADVSIEVMQPQKCHFRQCFFDRPHFVASVTDGRAAFTNCWADGVTGRFFYIPRADLYLAGNKWVANKKLLRRTSVGLRLGLKGPPFAESDGVPQFDSVDDVFEGVSALRSKYVRRPGWVHPHTIPTDNMWRDLKAVWDLCPT